MLKIKWVLEVVVFVAIVIFAVLWSPRGDAAPTPPDANTSTALTVELVTPQTRLWSQQISTNGAIAAWEEVVISPEVGGLRIAAMNVNVGDRVAKGQLLARLADETVRADLAKQEALLVQAEANAMQAQANLKRARTVDVAGAVSAKKMDEYQATDASAKANLASVQADVQSARLKLNQTRITASDEGMIAARSGVVGSVGTIGGELYRMIRQGRFEWRAELDAQQLALVRIGQTARVQLPTGVRVEGKIRLISPSISTTTGRGIVYVSLPVHLPNGTAVRSGVFANGTIELQQTPAITIPETAVVLRDGRSYVYWVRDGKASSRAVVTGRRQDNQVEIVSGLAAKEPVVAKGGAFLSEGARVSVATSTQSTGVAP